MSVERFSDEIGHLENWFASPNGLKNSKQIEKYLQEYSKKIINTPKYIRVEWLKAEQLFEVRSVSC